MRLAGLKKVLSDLQSNPKLETTRQSSGNIPTDGGYSWMTLILSLSRH
jgi:hypothetical protein